MAQEYFPGSDNAVAKINENHGGGNSADPYVTDYDYGYLDIGTNGVPQGDPGSFVDFV